MPASDVVQLGITNLVNLVRTHQLSPVELVESYLDRIESLNPSRNHNLLSSLSFGAVR